MRNYILFSDPLVSVMLFFLHQNEGPLRRENVEYLPPFCYKRSEHTVYAVCVCVCVCVCV